VSRGDDGEEDNHGWVMNECPNSEKIANHAGRGGVRSRRACESLGAIWAVLNGKTSADTRRRAGPTYRRDIQHSVFANRPIYAQSRSAQRVHRCRP
jgi:hypothetical protein